MMTKLASDLVKELAGKEIELAAKDAEIAALRDKLARAAEALEGNASWLERWAKHVGNCVGGASCTCGLTLARFECDAALAAHREATGGDKEGGE